MSDDIVQRLRDVGRDYDFHGNALIYEAADEIERQRARIAALEEALKKYDASLAAIGGCGDGGCVVIRPTGMHTNGGCRCMEDRMTARRFGTVTAAFTRAARAALAKGE